MKIAILGTENSHAFEFSKIINTEEKYKDVEIVGVYSYDEASMQKIIDAGFCSYAAKDPHEFLGKVDAVICTARHGDHHYDHAMPYIKAGIPCFIDKPFTVNTEKAEEMIKAAKENGTLLCGGSVLKYLAGLENIQKYIADGGEVIGGNIMAPIDLINPYGGFFFYSAHLVEMMLTAFGDGVKSVYARCLDENNKRVTFIADYGDFDVTGQYYQGASYICTMYAKNESISAEGYNGKYNLGAHFKDELNEFFTMLETKTQPFSYERQILPVKVLNAIYESYKTGKEVAVK